MDTVPYKVYVVVEREFGEKLAELERGVPVWIVDTPTNRPVAQRFWNERPGADNLTGITTFNDQNFASPAEMMLGQLHTIELHHGFDSANPPYTVIEVIGAQLTPEAKNAFFEYGFNFFHTTLTGFIASRAEKEVPRWLRVVAGLVLAFFTLLCGFASVTMLIFPNEKSPIFTVVVGLILLLGCLWALEKCFRLLTSRKNQGGLMAPNTLRVISFFFLALPVVGVFTGYYRRLGLVAVLQVVMYFLSFLGLRALARKREAIECQTRKPVQNSRQITPAPDR
jgi:hypothetical protein